MLSKVTAGSTLGLHGVLVEVEVDVAGRGFPTFTIVGLPGKSIDEAKERVRTAVSNAGYEMPDSRITVNLAPADVPKSGTAFDLAIAIGILTSSRVLEQSALRESMFIGELSLQGHVRRVNGIIPLIILAKEKQITTVYIPKENVEEASIFDDIDIYPVGSLEELISHLTGKERIDRYLHVVDRRENGNPPGLYDFSQIKGQEQAKRALEIAAAGFHNVHLKGSPGAGKTLLSRSMPTILPLLDKREMLEVAKIYSVTGEISREIFDGVRPFRAPHHTISRVGLIGGGSNPTPGEISMSHRGVLFLDEFPEFPRSVLEALRQPIEDGIVTVSRAAGTLTFPARFLLLAASNPCPCGYLGHPKRACKCSPSLVYRYQKRLSGPLLDRIDLHIDVQPVEVGKLSETYTSESSQEIRVRVEKARFMQKRRFDKTNISFNSEMSSSDTKRCCTLEEQAFQILNQAVERLSLSARSYFKMIKISRTIADLDGSEKISTPHITEALQYRAKES
ncbi:YifB family Mg chelatase-like AAA ATPase [Candidatus Roizmanbacteria bacterium]|nr:MAG: YifB family Mg chelatase-like AAA ATPase [Candidatus Roizmanbacteria bacterium]